MNAPVPLRHVAGDVDRVGVQRCRDCGRPVNPPRGDMRRGYSYPPGMPLWSQQDTLTAHPLRGAVPCTAMEAPVLDPDERQDWTNRITTAQDQVAIADRALRRAAGCVSIDRDPSDKARQAARSYRHAADALDPPPDTTRQVPRTGKAPGA